MPECLHHPILGCMYAGAEVLLRWRDPRRGIVGPAEFIGLAETCGLIQGMGHWVLHARCVQLSKWASRPER